MHNNVWGMIISSLYFVITSIDAIMLIYSESLACLLSWLRMSTCFLAWLSLYIGHEFDDACLHVYRCKWIYMLILWYLTSNISSLCLQDTRWNLWIKGYSEMIFSKACTPNNNCGWDKRLAIFHAYDCIICLWSVFIIIWYMCSIWGGAMPWHDMCIIMCLYYSPPELSQLGNQMMSG